MDLYTEALNKFRDLLKEVDKSDLPEPTAMTLATTDAGGQVTVRTVLLKKLDKRGFTFFTNLHSRKANQLTENPRAALCFFWQSLMQQVTVEGTVELISDEEANAYWATRERDSQLGAWASKQSEYLDSRDTLNKRLTLYREKFKEQSVRRPPNWSGYRVIPERIEFWKAGWHRLHERVCYSKSASGWSVSLLYP
jgi:pyridoxamine 5'-phosphate oxidase